MPADRLVLGVPAVVHRKALLRWLRWDHGGGNPPMLWRWEDGRWGPGPQEYRVEDEARALVLQHPEDPEAGAMGQSRLAWVAGRVLAGRPGRHWTVCLSASGGVVSVQLNLPGDTHWWTPDTLPALHGAACAAHAIGLVCVHLGLLEKVEIVDVN